VTSNYAISYKVTGIIDLQGKVKLFLRKDRPLKRSNCTTIKKMSGFTEKGLNLWKGSSNGQGIDFSKDFKIINSQRLTGEFDSAE
jgi:hypothetical protein